MAKMDELKIYRGDDVPITEKIIVKQPILNEIVDFGEQRYFNAVYTLTSVGADMKWQLWDYCNHTDYTKIDDYDLFIQLIYPMVSSKKKLHDELLSNKDKYAKELESLSDEDLAEMLINPLQLTLKDIDLADFNMFRNNKNNQIVLYDTKHDITIDRMIYHQIVDVVRKIHGFKRNNQIPANEQTKMDLIEDARDEAMMASKKPYRSMLKPLISALSVKNGQCGSSDIWNMPIYMFFDNIKRVTKIQDSQLLLQGAYSGFASLKGIDKNRLDWTGDI